MLGEDIELGQEVGRSRLPSFRRTDGERNKGKDTTIRAAAQQRCDVNEHGRVFMKAACRLFTLSAY